MRLYNSFVTISTIIFLFFSYLYWQAPAHQAIKIGTYIQILTLVIMTITGVIAILNYHMQIEDREKSVDVQLSNLYQTKAVTIDKMFMDNPNLTRLYCEMYQLDPTLHGTCSQQLPNGPLVEKHEHHAANIIFQTIDMVLETLILNPNQNTYRAWDYTFKKWMRSPILRKHWQFLRNEHSIKFQRYMDGIIRAFH